MILNDVRLFDEFDNIASAGGDGELAVLNWENAKMLSKQGHPVRVGTAVGILKERKRLRAIANPVVVKVVVLEGPAKDMVGWCRKNDVVLTATAPKLAAEKQGDGKDSAKKAETKLKMAQGLEKAKKPKAALDYYRESYEGVSRFPSGEEQRFRSRQGPRGEIGSASSPPSGMIDG